MSHYQILTKLGEGGMRVLLKASVGYRIVVSLLSVSWLYHLSLFPTIVRTCGAVSEEYHRLIRSSMRVGKLREAQQKDC
jgi:hypothetical protein